MTIKVPDHLPVFVPGSGPDWHRPQAGHLSGATVAVPGGKPIIPAGGLGNPAWSYYAVRAKLALLRDRLLLKVPSMPFTIRRLTAAASAYRDVRLEGLARYPDGFGSAWEDETEQLLAWFEQRIVNAAVFGGFLSDGTRACWAACTCARPLAGREWRWRSCKPF